MYNADTYIRTSVKLYIIDEILMKSQFYHFITDIVARIYTRSYTYEIHDVRSKMSPD